MRGPGLASRTEFGQRRERVGDHSDLFPERCTPQILEHASAAPGGPVLVDRGWAFALPRALLKESVDPNGPLGAWQRGDEHELPRPGPPRSPARRAPDPPSRAPVVPE